MKIILIFVVTLDGKITKWDNPFVRTWSSKTDQQYFNKIWNDSKLIVMGSNTYNADRIRPSPNHLLVIMTGDPPGYKDQYIMGQLEFTNETPAQLATRFNKERYDQMLVTGGQHIATSFLKEGLIDELWLTIEPKIFGMGENFVTQEKLDIDLNLISCEKVNERGTLTTKYVVIKS